MTEKQKLNIVIEYLRFIHPVLSSIVFNFEKKMSGNFDHVYFVKTTAELWKQIEGGKDE